jgi:GrpB-like predicted nucleotidyltransferase (UPF0157 family)
VRYVAVKVEAARDHYRDRGAYVEAKSPIVEALLAEARSRAARRRD